MRAVVITVSNRSAAGSRPDTSGSLLADLLRSSGADVDDPAVIPDGAESVAAALRAALDSGADVVVTTGGTGLSPTDRTPEGTRGVLDREAPGIAEAIRAASRDTVPTSSLSRGLAGVAGRALVINLPGSPGGVRDGMAVLDPLLAHAVEQIHGGDH